MGRSVGGLSHWGAGGRVVGSEDIHNRYVVGTCWLIAEYYFRGNGGDFRVLVFFGNFRFAFSGGI